MTASFLCLSSLAVISKGAMSKAFVMQDGTDNAADAVVARVFIWLAQQLAAGPRTAQKTDAFQGLE